MNGRGDGARWRSLLAIAVALVTLVALGPAVGPAQAATPTRAPSPDLADTVLIGADGIDPVLDEVSVETTPTVRRAEDRLIDVELAQAEATRRFTDADRARLDLVAKASSVAAALTDAEAALARAEAEVARQKRTLTERKAVTDRRRATLDREQDLLRELAVAMFTSKPRDEMVGLGTFDQMATGVQRDAVRGVVAEDQSVAVDEAEQAWRTARDASRAQQRRVDRAQAQRTGRAADVREAILLRDDVDLLLRAADERVAARKADLDRAGEAHHDARVDRRVARLTARVVDADFTLVGLHAYWRAAAVAPCAIPWWVLAGVGRVETHHGTAQGSTVGADGTTSTRILGIPLDGRPGVASVGDSDGGALDGSATVDRAVGPMQFIPSTWARWATDGNGDGTENPHNLYDAARAAADYLCFGRGPLLTDAAIRDALMSYNRSVPYGTMVLDVAHGYQRSQDLPDVPPEDAEQPADDAARTGPGG